MYIKQETTIEGRIYLQFHVKSLRNEISSASILRSYYVYDLYFQKVITSLFFQLPLFIN